MSFYDSFNQEELVDLLRAYDSYISTAADAGLLTSGWAPVCVGEFYDCEYQQVWDSDLGDESFYYMYDIAEKMVSAESEKQTSLNDQISAAESKSLSAPYSHKEPVR